MRICCISDTHEMEARIDIPQCDLLLHAGDISMMGHPAPILAFDRWCHSLITQGIVRKVVLIAGNHDFLFQDNPEKARSLIHSAAYLEDSGLEFEGLRIWGTPWQPWFYDWAFNIRTEEKLKEKFDLIPENTDIVVAHSPPRGILDATRRGEAVGSTSLLERINAIKPKLVVFGHIHESYGQFQRDGIIYVNASTCNFQYQPVHPPVLIDL